MNNLILTSVVIFLLIILWAGSIGFTYWDAVSRRKLSGVETAAWIALVVLVPFIGFAAYLFSRMLGLALSPNRPGGDRARRVTQLKPQVEPQPRSGTIPAAEYLQPYTTSTLPAATPPTGVEKGARKFVLSAITGPHAGKEYPLTIFPVMIGRGPDVSISLSEDHGVSRHHAEIYQQTGVLRIRDLNSTHGTKVNNFSISDKSLEFGDQIRVGSSVLRLTIQEGNQ